jgi:hypothetical protein
MNETSIKSASPKKSPHLFEDLLGEVPLVLGRHVHAPVHGVLKLLLAVADDLGYRRAKGCAEKGRSEAVKKLAEQPQKKRRHNIKHNDKSVIHFSLFGTAIDEKGPTATHPLEQLDGLGVGDPLEGRGGHLAEAVDAALVDHLLHKLHVL